MRDGATQAMSVHIVEARQLWEKSGHASNLCSQWDAIEVL
jgi:hypothetical protein